MNRRRVSLLPLVLSLAACGASLTSSGRSSSDDASARADAPVDAAGLEVLHPTDAPAAGLVVPGRELSPSVRAVVLRGPLPSRPGVYVFAVEGAPSDAPGLQLAVMEEEGARQLGEEGYAPSIVDARRWVRGPLR
jgi:hypothetical protein